MRIECVHGDITTQVVDAIVNAANEGLAPGAGVCGAIMRAGGPAIARECADLGGCPTGSAVATTGGDLPAGHVIHAVGPIWSGGDAAEDELLASAHRAALAVAVDLGCESVAFPAISTGIYGFPVERAAGVALDAVRGVDAPGVEVCRFVLFSPEILRAFEAA